MQGLAQDGEARKAFTRLSTVLALAVLALLWREGDAGISAALGVVLSVGTGFVALWKKRQGLGSSDQGVLLGVVWVFFLRVLVVATGLVVVSRWESGSPLDYIAGAFLAYLAGQFIEVKYLLAASKPAAARSE